MSDRNRAFLTVSQFGRLAQLSRKALRLYDARNLLKPVYVDPRNGYRYYTREQVVEARRIKLLRVMEMPLEEIARTLATWTTDPIKAQNRVRTHLRKLKEKYDLAQTAYRLLSEDFSMTRGSDMSFKFQQCEMPAQTVLCTRRRIRVPEFHQWIDPTLKALWAHIRESGAQPSGDPLGLYFGPVNEKDDGPVEIAIPFSGMVLPKGDMVVRELPAHHAVEIKTYGEYNEYPKLLAMWDALGKYVHEQQFESNWDQGLTTYEQWHEDCTMTIRWPVRSLIQADR